MQWINKQLVNDKKNEFSPTGISQHAPAICVSNGSNGVHSLLWQLGLGLGIARGRTTRVANSSRVQTILLISN